MRTRSEIEGENALCVERGDTSYRKADDAGRITIELLLDIRELLQGVPTTTQARETALREALEAVAHTPIAFKTAEQWKEHAITALSELRKRK